MRTREVLRVAVITIAVISMLITSTIAPNIYAVSVASEAAGGGGTVEGYKFEDINGDGVWDGDEPPLGGVTICVAPYYADGYYGDGVCTTTDNNGYYRIDNVRPGDIIVFEHIPPGYTPTTPPNGRLYTTINPNETIWVEFGNKPLEPIPSVLNN